MPVPPPPPPPPPAPPPSSIQSAIPKSNKQLLQSIEKGTKLKKVPECAKNDRSSGLVAAGVAAPGAKPQSQGGGARPPTQNAGASAAARPMVPGNAAIDFQSQLKNQLSAMKGGGGGGATNTSQDRKASLPANNNYVSVRPPMSTQPMGKQPPVQLPVGAKPQVSATRTPSSSTPPPPAASINGRPLNIVPGKPNNSQSSTINTRVSPPVTDTQKPSTMMSKGAVDQYKGLGKPMLASASITNDTHSDRTRPTQNQFSQPPTKIPPKIAPSGPSQSQSSNNNGGAAPNRFQSLNNKAPLPPNNNSSTNRSRPTSTSSEVSSNNTRGAQAPIQSQTANNWASQAPSPAISANNTHRPSLTNQIQSATNRAPPSSSISSNNNRRPSQHNPQSPVNNTSTQAHTSYAQTNNNRPPYTSNQNKPMTSASTNNNRPSFASIQSREVAPVMIENNRISITSNQIQAVNNRVPTPTSSLSANARPPYATNQNTSTTSSRAPPNQFQSIPYTTNQNAFTTSSRAPPPPNQFQSTDNRAAPPPPPSKSKPVTSGQRPPLPRKRVEYVMPGGSVEAVVQQKPSMAVRSAPNIPNTSRPVSGAPPPGDSVEAVVQQKPSMAVRSAPNIPNTPRPVSGAPPPPPPPMSASYVSDQPYKIMDRAPPPPPPPLSAMPTALIPGLARTRNPVDVSGFDRRFRFPAETEFPVL